MRLRRPRFTIERLRTLVLIGGALLVVAIAVFLTLGHWKRRFLLRDLPKRLGIDIQQQANGVDYTKTRNGKTLFKMHAARLEQMKASGKTLLHDVHIDLYGEDGTRADTISGSEFEYDPPSGIAHAAGAVEISLMRSGVKPAVAQLEPGAAKNTPVKAPDGGAVPGAVIPASVVPGAVIPGAVSDNEIHVKTSGLFFNQKSGLAMTEQRVDFALRQGSGNSIGATYDSAKGELVLDHAVELHADRGAAKGGNQPVTVHATHAEFHRGQELCQLTQAVADYASGTAKAADAQIHFRQDGSVLRMDGSGGVDLTTLKGSHVTAPRGSLDFDEHNHPHAGLLQGGAQLAMTQPDRQVQGSASTARLFFDGQGELRQTHLEDQVVFESRQQTKTAKGAPAEVLRTWKSQSADIDFAAAVRRPGSKSGSKSVGTSSGKPSDASAQGNVEPRTIHGFGGVLVTAETRAEGRVIPSSFSADTVIADLSPGAVLSSMSGSGRARFEQRTALGVRQTSSSDQLDVHFKPPAAAAGLAGTGSAGAGLAGAGSQVAAGSQIAAMHQFGHVVLVQEPPPARAGQTEQAAVRATADRADYDGDNEMLHLWGSPRVRDGALDMTANEIDFARATGDAFAHGDVKASWTGSGLGGSGSAGSGSASLPGAGLLAGAGGAASPGANGPVHAVAPEAELHQAAQEVVFRAAPGKAGSLPRLWQAANSVTAPLITLNRQKQTLTAMAAGLTAPVTTVLINNSNSNSNSPGSRKVLVGNGTGGESGATASGGRAARAKGPGAGGGAGGKSEAPSVIRVRSGDLHYSEGERLAVFHAGVLGNVKAETTETGGVASLVAQQVDVKLVPAGVHTSGPGASNSTVDQLTARGQVTVDWPERKGVGDKLVYLSDDGTFTLTGTSAAPPRMTDPARGTVTGRALIYHSREENVSVEGDGAKTVTETQSPKKR